MPNPMRTNAENATSAVRWRFTNASAPLDAPEREADDEEREPEAERVGDEQRRAGPHAVLVRRDGEDRPQDRPDARRPTEPECGARDERRGLAEAAELRVEALLLVEPRRAQEQRPEQEQAHADHDRARDARRAGLGGRRASGRSREAVSPSITNTLPKPSTNIDVVRTTRRVCSRVPSSRVDEVEAGHHRQVGGDERQHARRQERHDPAAEGREVRESVDVAEPGPEGEQGRRRHGTIVRDPGLGARITGLSVGCRLRTIRSGDVVSAKDMFDLSGKVAVLTGVGSGIGKATAVTLAAAGATIVGGDIDEVAAQATADESRPTARPHRCAGPTSRSGPMSTRWSTTRRPSSAGSTSSATSPASRTTRWSPSAATRSSSASSRSISRACSTGARPRSGT